MYSPEALFAAVVHFCVVQRVVPLPDIWATRISECIWALGPLASAVNIGIKSYIESVLKIIKGCLQKRGSPKGRRATSTCLGALPTRSDPTCSGSTTRCATCCSPRRLRACYRGVAESVQSQPHVLTPTPDRESIILTVHRPCSPTAQSDILLSRQPLNVIGALAAVPTAGRSHSARNRRLSARPRSTSSRRSTSRGTRSRVSPRVRAAVPGARRSRPPPQGMLRAPWRE